MKPAAFDYVRADTLEEALATLGTVTTPTLSDLFVALMTREQGAH